MANPKNSTRNTADPIADLRDPAVLLSLLIAGLAGAYLLLTSTTNLIPGIWPYDGKRMLQFLLLLVLFLVPMINRKIRAEFADLLDMIPAWTKATLLAVFAWGLLSVAINAQSLMHALNSFSEVALLTALAIGTLVVGACRRIGGRSFDRLAVGLLAMTGLAVGLQELIGVFAAHNAGVDFNFRVSLLHFSWPRFYNQVQSWVVPVLVALPLLFSRYLMSFILCGLVLGLQWYIILMTGARGTFVSVGAAIILALVLVPRIRVRLAAWQATGFVIGALVFSLVLLSFEAGKNAEKPEGTAQTAKPSVIREADRGAGQGQISGGESSFFKQSVGRPMTHTSGRTWMWRSALEDVRDYPLAGIGPMNYACTSNKRIGHPHNFPLQLAAEWGVPVALAIAGLFVFFCGYAVAGIRNKRFDHPDDALLAGLLLTGILAAALHACLSGVLVMPASQVTGLLTCGMLVGLFPTRAKKQRPVARWRLLPGLLLASFLVALGTHELQTMKSRSELLEPGASMWPRIWQDSKVCRLYNVHNGVNN
ncbi:MAG: O-antigen ligase family protein [Xanthomonadales bacterium]|nr:O-antigen ligase family protein [Xanthomonadales bacterium]